MPPRLTGLRHVQASNVHRAVRLPVFDFLLPWAANLERAGESRNSNPRIQIRGGATAAATARSSRDDDLADEGWTASYRTPETGSHLSTLEASSSSLNGRGGSNPSNAAAGPSRLSGPSPPPSLALPTTSRRNIRRPEAESHLATLEPSSPRRKSRGSSIPANSAAGPSCPSFGPPPPPSVSLPITPYRNITPARSVAHALKPLPRDTPLPRLTALSRSPKHPNMSGPDQPPRSTHVSQSLQTTLSRHNPPEPRHLLNQLRHEPSRFSRDDGELLMSYSRRMSDARTERRMKDLMGRMRLAPVEWVKAVREKPAFRAVGRSVRPGERIVQRSTANQGLAPDFLPPPSHPWTETPPAANPAFSADMEEAGLSVTPPKRRRPILLSLRLNTWAVRSWPPNLNLALPCTPYQFLQYTHHRLALSDAPRPQLAEMLDALRSFLPAHEPQDALDVLHLFLAYSSRPAHAPPGNSSNSPPTVQRERHDLHHQPEAFSVSLLDQFIELYPAISPSRQTLHLIIAARLRSNRTRSPSDVNESVVETYASGPIDSTDPLVIIRDFALRWNVTPGLATLRHLLRYAVRKDLVHLAEYAWNAWSAECARMRSIRDREEATGSASPSSITSPASSPGPSTSTSTSTRHTATARFANGAVQDGVEARTGVGTTRVRFRFWRLGREGWRWGRALRFAEKRGWVRRDETERHGWTWVGAVPSEAATTTTTTATATATTSETELPGEDGEERDSVV